MLVEKFQERLQVSRKNAIWRVLGFFFFVTCAIATIAIVFVIFPYTAKFTEEIPLLPGGSYVKVEKVLKADVLVNQSLFLRMAEGNPAFISFGEKFISYVVKVAGVSFRYDQDICSYGGYFVSSQQIKGETLTREVRRDTLRMIVFYIILPLLFLYLFYLLMGQTQLKWIKFNERINVWPIFNFLS